MEVLKPSAVVPDQSFDRGLGRRRAAFFVGDARFQYFVNTECKRVSYGHDGALVPDAGFEPLITVLELASVGARG